MYREEIFLEKLSELAKPVQKTQYIANYEITKNTDLLLLVLPQWSNYLPPFALARLSAILLENGFSTKCIDLNIQCSNLLQPHLDELGYDPWTGAWIFKWQGENYFNEIHPYFEEFFLKTIDSIVEANPKVIGFSMYWTNTAPTEWFINILRKRLPNTIFIGGGPSSQSSLDKLKSIFDITVVGEAERLILEIMEQIEDNLIDKTKFPYSITQPFKERLSLDTQPIPNFTDFDLNLYRVPNGIVTEFSRGCVAKCTFCEETHFWNFRQRGYMSLVDEIEFLNKNYGLDSIWFIDSLINGSLKELEEFAKEVIRRELKIKFFGYARHDKRMDLNYFKLLSQAGLVAFQYGSESGSNKVLSDMKKRVTKEDMEQNFIDGEKTNIQSVTGWVIGFPTETVNDLVDTMTLIWRNRNTSISNVVNSTRFHMNSMSIVGQNPQRFGLKLLLYNNCWIRDDLTLGKPHLSLRSKCFQIFVEELGDNSKKFINHFLRPNFKKEGYILKYINRNTLQNVKFETFDYSIINLGNAWVDSFLNEPFGLFRFLWRVKGGYSLTIFFKPELDKIEFGPSLENNLQGAIKFSIDNSGVWEYDVDVLFTQNTNPWRPINREFFFNLSASQIRARKLAGIEKEISESDYTKLEQDALELNKNLDLSFEVKERFKGDWTIKGGLI